jgi:predicted O-methyltransferase YrrM
MGKITKLIRSVREIIRNPRLLNLVLSDNSVWEKNVLRKFGLNAALPLIPLEELIPEFNETREVLTGFDGGCLPADIALLKALCRKFPVCSYFEIGTWHGESVRNVSTVAADCYTLDLTNEEISRKNFPDDYQQMIGNLSEGIANVKHLKGDSMNFDFSSLDRKFDLIFIDGDHRYDFVRNDTVMVFRHLVHDKSIVVWHDYAYSPGQVRYEVLAGILDGVPKTFRQCLYQVSGTKCAVFFNYFQDP